MRDVLASVVCGIDESPEGLEALRQAERLRPPSGELHLVTVEAPTVAAHWPGAAVLVQPGTQAQDALARAGRADDDLLHRDSSKDRPSIA